MGYRVVLLKGAIENLREIREYLACYYPGTPARFRKEFEKQVVILQRNPRIFEVYQENPVFRKMLVFNYIAFYKVDETNKLVQIYRVLHGARDIKQFLEK